MMPLKTRLFLKGKKVQYFSVFLLIEVGPEVLLSLLLFYYLQNFLYMWKFIRFVVKFFSNSFSQFFDIFLSPRYLKPHQASRCGFQDSRMMALPGLSRWSGAECAPEVQPQMHTNSARAHAGTLMFTQTM